MSDFNIAYAKTGHAEGGYANNPDDSGGETVQGISRNNFPKWRGWMIVDLEKGKMVPQPAYGTTAYYNCFVLFVILLSPILCLHSAVS